MQMYIILIIRFLGFNTFLNAILSYCISKNLLSNIDVRPLGAGGAEAVLHVFDFQSWESWLFCMNFPLVKKGFPALSWRITSERNSPISKDVSVRNLPKKSSDDSAAVSRSCITIIQSGKLFSTNAWMKHKLYSLFRTCNLV